MGKFKSYGCSLSSDDQFCDMWTKRQVRKIWGDQQQKPIRPAWKDHMTPLLPVGHYPSRKLNFSAGIKEEKPKTQIPWRYSHLRDKTK